jgi:hypothetical protein
MGTPRKIGQFSDCQRTEKMRCKIQNPFRTPVKIAYISETDDPRGVPKDILNSLDKNDESLSSKTKQRHNKKTEKNQEHSKKLLKRLVNTSQTPNVSKCNN